MAALEGHSDIVEMLLDANANINTKAKVSPKYSITFTDFISKTLLENTFTHSVKYLDWFQLGYGCRGT